jgi:hypothetical protein
MGCGGGGKKLASPDQSPQTRTAARRLFVKALSRRVFSCAFSPGSYRAFVGYLARFRRVTFWRTRKKIDLWQVNKMGMPVDMKIL